MPLLSKEVAVCVHQLDTIGETKHPEPSWSDVLTADRPCGRSPSTATAHCSQTGVRFSARRAIGVQAWDARSALLCSLQPPCVGPLRWLKPFTYSRVAPHIVFMWVARLESPLRATRWAHAEPSL